MNSQKSDYRYSIEASPDYALAEVTLQQGQSLRVEASAMAYMDSSLAMKTSAKGGLGRLLSGERLFQNEFSAPQGSGTIGIAPGCPGDITHLYLEDEGVYIQNSAYLASSPELEVRADFQGWKGFFSGEKLFMIGVEGRGDLWFNSYGGILAIDVQDSYVVDTGYIAAFTQGLTYDVRPVSGLKSLFFSGEGLVCRFTGRGTVWIQTRLAPAFVQWADAYRRVQKQSNS
ncbi:TIGR00266 family protein [Spirochaeta lutea]|uniref:TIGR00266 family protein n=1 Tax=Spirochaeta lutea TaxID=1480694 RepID=A0A098R295_9SPIO|nr:TIGR00266 family protein [Spirochaeta lutea]KGE73881.1 hypothetical protein DC28_01375 [Spirochaeta lutea]